MIRCGANKTRPSMETLLAHEEEGHNSKQLSKVYFEIMPTILKDYFQIFLV